VWLSPAKELKQTCVELNADAPYPLRLSKNTQAPMPLLKLEHYLVLTDDIEKTKDFCRDVIGLAVGFRADLGFPGYWLYLGDRVLRFTRTRYRRLH